MPRSVDELARLVEYHQDRYYNAQPEISDAEFDAIWDELKERAPDHPLFSRVGQDGSAGFPKVDHLMTMGSQEKASSPEQLQKWAARIKHPRYIVQHKLDGASLELQYEDGRFRRGVTRGDGVRGDDITENVRKMQGVVATLAAPFTGAIRGEVIMTHAVHAAHFPDKANCRNAANGLMKRKDGVGSEYLMVMCYDAHTERDQQYFSDEEEKLAWLRTQGFRVVPFQVFDDVEGIIQYRDEIAGSRGELDYDIDGLVVKGPQIDRDDMRRPRPQKQIAFKFSAEEAVSVLRSVEWSPSGHLYTPVGIIDPVSLAGTTVRRASLVHPELISSMALRLDSEVIVTKRGDIIPKIERLVRYLPEAREITVPTHCEVCGTPLVNEGKRLYCPNQACSKRNFHRLQKWISVLDIRDFGDVLLGKLFDSGRVREIADLYTLRWEELAAYEGMAETSARKALTNLRAVTSVPLARFVAGFNIFGIAELKVQKLVDAGFDTLDKLATAEPTELAEAEGVALITAEQIAEGLTEVRDKMDAVLATGAVAIASPAGGSGEKGSLTGLTFCFTGSLESMKRSEAERLVRERGGQSRSSVSGELSYVVAGDPGSGSSKLKKAAQLGLPVISEEEFRQLVQLD